MGRDAGHIVLNAGIGAGAEEIYTRRKFGIRSIIRIFTSGKSSSIVVIAEGDKIGKNVFN
jgi:6-phosphofructokinase 1